MAAVDELVEQGEYWRAMKVIEELELKVTSAPSLTHSLTPHPLTHSLTSSSAITCDAVG
jgi:hypothetical protein